MSVDYDQDTNIGRNDRSAIKGLNSLWKRIPVDSACDNVIDLVTQIQHCKQYEPNGDWNSVEASADSNMRSLVDLENRIQLKQAIANDLVNDIEQEAIIVKPEDLYRQKLSDLERKYNSKTSRQKYADSDKFASYYNAIWAVSKPEEVVPSIRKLIPRESEDADDDDSDIEIGSIRQNFNDPIDLGLFENPYTSDECKHSYSFNSIKEYLGGLTKKCPYSGCSVDISMRDLREDHRLARRVKQIANKESETQHYHQIDIGDE